MAAEIAQMNISVLAHENANEPAVSVQLWQQFVASCIKLVIGFSCLLLVASCLL
jgi:hypothetical protein